MKSHSFALAHASLSLALLVSFGSLALAQDQTVNGNLAVKGDTDLVGNTLSFGTRTDSNITPGLNLNYIDAVSPTIYFNATRSGANWLWQSNINNTYASQLKLTSANQLQLFDQSATPVAKIILDPLGTSVFSNQVAINGSVSGIFDGLKLYNSNYTNTGTTGTGLIFINDSNPGNIGAKIRAVRVGPYDVSDLIFLTNSYMVAGDNTLERVRITSGGNVGIGTSSPAEKLDVVGNGKISGTLTVGGVPVLTSSGNGSGLTGLNASQLTTGTLPTAVFPLSVVQTATTQTLTNKTLTGATLSGATVIGGASAGQQVLVDATGNLGIGTATPMQKLDVYGNGQFAGRVGIMTGTPTNSYLQVGANGGNSLALDTYPVTGIDTRPMNGGNGGVVGVFAWPIQAKTPVGPTGDVIAFQGKVRAAGGNVTNGKVLEALSPDITTSNGSSFSNVYGVYINPQKMTGVSAGYGVYQTSATDTNYFAGNVGIGTTAPLAKLDVNGGINFASGNVVGAANLNISTDTFQSYYYGLSRNSQFTARFNGMKVYNVVNDVNLPASKVGFFTDNTGHTASTEWMTINELGNVGIGTTTPSVKLEVVGDAKVQGNLTVTGNLIAPNGALSGGTSGLTLSAGGTNQNLTLSPTGTGSTIATAPVAITSSAVSTSGTTGALTVAGGVGVAGSLNITGTSTFSNSVVMNGTNNLMPNQTLTGPTSVLTRGLADVRYIKNAGTGSNSLAIGYYAIASGSYSNSTGYNSGAIGDQSNAIAYNSRATGGQSNAVGNNSIASGNYSTAIGFNSNASGDASTTIGPYSKATGYGSIATGFSSTASGYASTASGGSSIASGGWSNASGLGSITSGDYSYAGGQYTNASGYNQFVIGRYNMQQGQATAWAGYDDLFVIGNGDPGGELLYYTYDDETGDINGAVTSPSVPSNAFIVQQNGNVRSAGSVQAKGGFRTPPMGDLSMGSFTAGANPADPTTGLNAGLRYPNE